MKHKVLLNVMHLYYAFLAVGSPSFRVHVHGTLGRYIIIIIIYIYQNLGWFVRSLHTLCPPLVCLFFISWFALFLSSGFKSCERFTKPCRRVADSRKLPFSDQFRRPCSMGGNSAVTWLLRGLHGDDRWNNRPDLSETASNKFYKVSSINRTKPNLKY